jgi:hypothetical protein
MVIREANGELDISGSPAELNAIAARIERLADDGGSLSVDADAVPPFQPPLPAIPVRCYTDRV